VEILADIKFRMCFMTAHKWAKFAVILAMVSSFPSFLFFLSFSSVLAPFARRDFSQPWNKSCCLLLPSSSLSSCGQANKCFHCCCGLFPLSLSFPSLSSLSSFPLSLSLSLSLSSFFFLCFFLSLSLST